MSLLTLNLPIGATIGATGGTATAFANDGATVVNGLHLIVPTDTSYITRRNLTAKVKKATVQKDGSLSKIKRNMSYVVPFTLASGVTVYNVMRVELDIHPEAEATLRSQLLNVGALLLTDSDTVDFWTVGSLA